MVERSKKTIEGLKAVCQLPREVPGLLTQCLEIV